MNSSRPGNGKRDLSFPGASENCKRFNALEVHFNIIAFVTILTRAFDFETDEWIVFYSRNFRESNEFEKKFKGIGVKS